MLSDAGGDVVFLASLFVDDEADYRRQNIQEIFYSEIAARVWLRETLIDEIVDMGISDVAKRARFRELCQSTDLELFFASVGEFGYCSEYMPEKFMWKIKRSVVRNGPTRVQPSNIFASDRH
jgi:hypothetical protein